ncbi:MAG: carbon-nitrogen hydrolase family protein [Spirochaetia bacterium]|nr:carbon-nitrogen hydrolase family protein [Spirochaetia bacterium]
MNSQVNKKNLSLKSFGVSCWQSPGFLLILGSLLAIASGMRWNVSIAAWIFPVPFLYYLRLGYSKKWLLLTLVFSFTLQVSKIVSDPFYIFIALFSGPLSGLFFWLIYLLKDKIRKLGGETISIFALPVLISIYEIVSARFSPLGTWGMFANTQMEDLSFLQLVSVTGAAGIAFFMSWFAALFEALLFALSEDKPDKNILSQIGVFATSILAVYFFGVVRLDMARPSKVIEAATVSYKTYEVSDVMNSEDARKDNNRHIIELIEKAAQKNISLVVTNEGALFLLPTEVDSTLEKLIQISKTYSTDLVVGYIIYKNKNEKFVNKSIWISKGEILQNYHKQFVPPGEPSVHIADEIKLLHTPFGAASMAICYDFDSISITDAHGKIHSSLVALPSSDWRGIDPVHTQMSRIRAIENGYSVVRSVRAAASEVYDGLGRSRAMSLWKETENEIMLAQVPVEPVFTIYKLAPNWFLWLNLLGLLLIIYKVWFSSSSSRNFLRHRPPP